MKKDKTLTLAIVIPVFNEQSHLKSCLEAIAKQSDMPNEVIVVDNNSTDDTIAIAKQFEFVNLIVEKKQGVLNARNTGFSKVKSDIIGRIDADTRIDKDWTRQVLRIFSDEDVAAATGPVYWYDMPLKEKNYVAEHAFKKLLYKYDKEFPFLLGANMAVRKSVWDQVSSELCPDKTIHEDMDLAIHLYLDNEHIVYDAGMRAGASSRRFDSGPEAFFAYSEMMTNSFAIHDMNPIGAKVAIAAYSFGYLALSPLRRAYDDDSGRRSIKRLFKKSNTPRNNPNGEI